MGRFRGVKNSAEANRPQAGGYNIYEFALTLKARFTSSAPVARRAGLRRPFVVEACSALLWQVRNGTERAERGRTSVAGGGRADVVRESKR